MRRLGDTKTVKLNVRVISATNTDLPKAIKDGTFRDDLYYRLNGITLFIPPLRERKEDIPLLAAHFVSMQNKRFNTHCTGFTKEAMDVLVNYLWQGNIRELKNVVESAMALESEKYITLETLRQFIDIAKEETRDDLFVENGEYNNALTKFETDYFSNLLITHNWNVEDAAKTAGVNVVTLYRKIKKYNLKKVQ